MGRREDRAMNQKILFWFISGALIYAALQLERRGLHGLTPGRVVRAIIMVPLLLRIIILMLSPRD